MQGFLDIIVGMPGVSDMDAIAYLERMRPPARNCGNGSLASSIRPATDAQRPGGLRHVPSRLRHDLRTPLNAIKGMANFY